MMLPVTPLPVPVPRDSHSREDRLKRATLLASKPSTAVNQPPRYKNPSVNSKTFGKLELNSNPLKSEATVLQVAPSNSLTESFVAAYAVVPSLSTATTVPSMPDPSCDQPETGVKVAKPSIGAPPALWKDPPTYKVPLTKARSWTAARFEVGSSSPGRTRPPFIADHAWLLISQRAMLLTSSEPTRDSLSRPKPTYTLLESASTARGRPTVMPFSFPWPIDDHVPEDRS